MNIKTSYQALSSWLTEDAKAYLCRGGRLYFCVARLNDGSLCGYECKLDSALLHYDKTTVIFSAMINNRHEAQIILLGQNNPIASQSPLIL